MFPTTHAGSRYLRVARRAQLARLVAAGAIVAIPLACGTDDEAVLGDAAIDAGIAADSTDGDGASTATGGEDASTTTGQHDSSGADATTADPTSPTEPTAESYVEGATSVDTTFPAGAELVVEFTFDPSGNGRVLNPYVAVWVEDAAGDLVDTISVWYEQSSRGARWLDDLRQWYAASDGGADVTMSSATRPAGTYAVVWDGTDADGDLVPAGEYVLYVEAAREHGPYEITSTALTVDGSADGFTVALPDDGELVDLTASLTA